MESRIDPAQYSLYETGPATRDGVPGAPLALAGGFSVDRLEHQTADLPAGRGSGWRGLDRLDVRFQPGELTVVAGRIGHGKTAVLTSLLLNWLRQEPQPEDDLLLFYSFEEPEVRVYHRLLAAVTAGYNLGWTTAEIRDWFRDPGSRGASYIWPDAQALSAAREWARRWEERLALVYQPNWTVAEIESHARSIGARRRIGAVMVDYLQKVPSGHGTERPHLAHLEVSHRLKALATALACPLVVGAQLRRASAADGARIPETMTYDHDQVQRTIRQRRPRLQHLAETGCDEEADVALGLLNYRAEFEAEVSEERRQAARVGNVTRLDIGVLKSRYGTAGRWAGLAFEGRYGLVRDPKSDSELGN
ncbi:MAG: AAA family ATPase [Armatimonadetes bacterium]|nr:AAA family ATPase [Armatimonadota bacterium]